MDKSYGFSHTFRVGKMFDLKVLKEITGKPDWRNLQFARWIFGDTNLLVIGDIKPSHSFTLTSREVLNPHQTKGEITQLKVNGFSPLKFGEKGGYSTPQ